MDQENISIEDALPQVAPDPIVGQNHPNMSQQPPTLNRPQNTVPPSPPTPKSFPTKKLIIIGAVILVVIALIAVTYLLYLSKQKVSSANSVSETISPNQTTKNSESSLSANNNTKPTVPAGWLTIQPSCSLNIKCPLKISYPPDWVESIENNAVVTSISNPKDKNPNYPRSPGVIVSLNTNYKDSKAEFPSQTGSLKDYIYSSHTPSASGDKIRWRLEPFSFKGKSAYKFYLDNRLNSIIVEYDKETELDILYPTKFELPEGDDTHLAPYQEVINTIEFL